MGNRTCTVADCGRRHSALGYCRGHYARWQSGRPVDSTPLRDYVLTDDLSVRLTHYAPPSAPGECWEWSGARNKGYGVFSVHGSKPRVAHVVAWELHTGRQLPDGMVVRHTCDNPPCCNPAHLLLGTHGDNNRDKAERGRCGYNGKGFTHLNHAEVREIRQLHQEGINMTEIARRYGRSRATIIRVVHRQVFANVA